MTALTACGARDCRRASRSKGKCERVASRRGGLVWRSSFTKSSGQLLAGFVGETFLIVRRENFAGDFCGRVNHEAADFTAEFGQHAGAILFDLFARLGGKDLLRFDDRLLRLPVPSRAQPLRAPPRSIYSPAHWPGSRCPGATSRCPQELRLDLVGVVEAFLDANAAFLQHLQDAFIGKEIKQRTDDAETDDLRNQMRPIGAECIRGLLRRIAESRSRCSPKLPGDP